MTIGWLNKAHFYAIAILMVLICSCKQARPQRAAQTIITPLPKNIAYAKTTYKCIHVFVALCDNKYQGIIPVPAAIGNGQDPENNLYWGGDYGARTFFKRSKDWKLVRK